MVQIEVSPGELLDRISILEIKQQRIPDPERLLWVRRELESLRAVREQLIPASERVAGLAAELRAVNEALWTIEDEIRGCERRGDFGPRFVELARSVYRENDRRADLKRRVNALLGANTQEQKWYPSRADHPGDPPAASPGSSG